MRGTMLLDKMALIDPAYVEAADVPPKRRKNSWMKWSAAAACLCLIFVLTVPVMAAGQTLYHMLYAVSPATAQRFRPIQRSCEDQGIRMEVVAAYIHEDTAEIYISLQDLQGGRLDETIDLFDSYQINSPFDFTGHCKFSGFDPDTQTATFLITIEQWNKQDIAGDKLTFSIRKILGSKKTFEGVLENVQLDAIELTAATQTIRARGFGGLGEYGNTNAEEGVTVLKPVGNIPSPVDGAVITGVGYVDGNLHVQVYYEDILNTDNHGSIALLHRETGETIICNSSVSFFDDENKGSYDDYIFTGISVDALGDYALYGYFVTATGSVEGNWSITFPLENTAERIRTK